MCAIPWEKIAEMTTSQHQEPHEGIVFKPRRHIQRRYDVVRPIAAVVYVRSTCEQAHNLVQVSFNCRQEKF